jgi:hypothetical protein
LNLGSNFVVLNKIAAVCGCQAKIHRLNKAAIVLEVAAQYLLCQFVGLQPPLLRDLGELRFFWRLKSHFHGHSLERFMNAVKHHSP